MYVTEALTCCQSLLNIRHYIKCTPTFCPFFKGPVPSAPATARPSSNRIFINENLTAHRRNLVRMANDMKQDGILKGVWTVDGKSFVKTSPEGRPLRINTEDDLDEL